MVVQASLFSSMCDNVEIENEEVKLHVNVQILLVNIMCILQIDSTIYSHKLFNICILFSGLAVPLIALNLLRSFPEVLTSQRLPLGLNALTLLLLLSFYWEL